jgi:hypothetical protein
MASTKRGLPRFLPLSNKVAIDDNRKFILCTNRPACLAEVFEVDGLQLDEWKNSPPEDWIYKGEKRFTFNDVAINGKFYFLVVRDVFTELKNKDFPLIDLKTGGVLNRMSDWLHSALKSSPSGEI